MQYLNQVASFSVAALNASDASLLFSPDSAILYMNDSAFVYATMWQRISS